MEIADRRFFPPLLPPLVVELVVLNPSSEAIPLVFAFWRGRGLGYRRRDTRCRCTERDATCWALGQLLKYHSTARIEARCCIRT